ncbi:MAG: glycerol-3-phosphate O-acyltransferase/dihydroxyacetone phosphate acyltransferase [Arenicella sp.]|jgi:glycerol-3-phosphate O-acyltransferase/dihydroxyacetone phosphate acyltransferase
MYHLLKILCKLTLLAYFRKVKIEGREHLKGEGPFIFVANHPSAFMDPVVVASSIKPSVFFLAAGEYMGKGFKFWFFHKFLHMIPIYRPSTMPGDAHKNKEAFAKSIEHLTKKKCLLVFPEGVSVTEKKILPLKTGVARIARETEIALNLKAGIKIVPIGLNYTDPHSFRSDLFVNIGEPILAADFFTNDPDKGKEEVKALTQHIEERMIDTVLHIESKEVEDIIDSINKTYSRDLKSELGVQFTDQNREFELNKLTIAAVNHFQANMPEDYSEMTTLMDDYIGTLDEKGIRDREYRNVEQKVPWYLTIGYFVGAPFFLLGWLCNYIPYITNTFLQKKLGFKDSFKGSMILGIGLGLFLVWFSLLTVLCWSLTPLSYYSLLVPVVLYISGTYALIYLSSVNYVIRRMKLRTFLKANSDFSKSAAEKRALLIQKLEGYRAEFDKTK